MFDSLKKKFSGTVSKLAEKVSQEEKVKKAEGDLKDKKSSSAITSKNKYQDQTSTEKVKPYEEYSTKDSDSKEDNKKLVSEEVEEKKEKSKSGVFSFIREKTISKNDIDELLWELEMSLLESDVALEVAEKIINSVKNDLVGKKIKRSSDISDYTLNALKKAVSEILDVESKNIDHILEEKKAIGEPLIIMFVGINGTGKTTTIAKISTYFINKGHTPVIAASDTFRAGAIEQISHHAETIGVKIIKHKKGADPAAVAYDAVSHARAQNKEIVLVDTAGRMQTNINLMDEMAKIKRVVSPDLIIFVGDSLTGNDAVDQANKFNDSVGLDGIILTKADADAKGGAALSIGYVINKPILFLGVGQGYEDLVEFKPEWMVEQLL
ncbi:MAG: signal recognition particle-docking protein FtsY [Methanobacteriaceae archaeon]|nr:signal recognition particle-docking protein FtsY [Methanobacteriaceae archaeon]